MVAVNPEILIWARKTAALSVEEAARKLGFRDSKRHTAVEKLELLEKGEDERGKIEPTRSQLNAMARVYRQPLLVFYLRKPPKKGDRGEDFRSLQQSSSNPRENAYLDILMRNVKAAQSIVRDLLEDDETERLDFVGSARMDMGEEAIAESISNKLNFDLQRFRSRRSYSDAFGYLRDQIEGLGIFVLRLSDLGNYHTSIPADVFRGFVYADPIAPFVVINRNDAKSAYSFTAIHELAHIWIGSSGISGELGHDTNNAIEHFCDRVAARLLLPEKDLDTIGYLRRATNVELVTKIGGLSSEWKVSRTMIAYNLLHHDIISFSRWETLSMQFRQEYLKQKQLEKDERDSRENRPINMNGILRNNLGKRLVDHARAWLAEGTLTPSKASVVLSVTPRRVDAILNP
ncbi:MAG: ImmA/IrrE family metallo-endopeptidase [Chloroflexota bacterium]|nr:ImmA/IrrE family metallo-endopeptidase [Chloroflexota bacterium]